MTTLFVLNTRNSRLNDAYRAFGEAAVRGHFTLDEALRRCRDDKLPCETGTAQDGTQELYLLNNGTFLWTGCGVILSFSKGRASHVKVYETGVAM